MATKKNNNSNTKQKQNQPSDADKNQAEVGGLDSVATHSTKPPITIDQPLENAQGKTEQKTEIKTKKSNSNSNSSTRSKHNSQTTSPSSKQSKSNNTGGNSSKSKNRSWFSRFFRFLIAVIIVVLIIFGAGIAYLYYNEDISISGIFTQNLEENEAFQKFSSRLSEIEQRQDQVDSDVSELTTSFADISIAELMEIVNENQKKIEELSQQLNSDLTTLAEQAIEDPQISLTQLGLATRITELENLVEANNESIKTLESLMLTQSNAMKTIQAQVTSLTSQNVSAQTVLANITEQIKLINQKVNNSETTINDLTTQLENKETVIEDKKAYELVANVIAASAFKDAVIAGQPFASELDAVANIISYDTAVSLLSKYAKTGIPTNTNLIQQFSPIAQSMNSAITLGDSSAGFFDKFVASIKSRIVIRRTNEEGTSNPLSQIGKMEELVLAERFNDALDIYESLPETVKAPAVEWVDMVTAKIEADNLVKQIFQNVSDAHNASKN